MNPAQSTADDAFGPDNSGHDTDCDCKACLVDAWHAEVERLYREVARLRAGISWARGMCSDAEPWTKIDAYLGGLLR